MELEQLRTFAVVARLGSLSAASGAVNLSQPAVSRQIQALERRLGARLMERGARGIQLTEAGEMVARGAADVLARLEELEAELALLRGGEGGTLRLGATVTVCLYLLPPLLRRYRERYPRQEIVLINERSRQIPELVRDRRIDIGIASSTVPPPGVRRIPWQELSLVLLDSSRNLLPRELLVSLLETAGADSDGGETKRGVVRHSALTPSPSSRAGRGVPGKGTSDVSPLPVVGRGAGGEGLPCSEPVSAETPFPFVLATSGSLRSLTEQVLAGAGIEPRVVAEADSLEVVKRLVQDGFGRALVPAACVTDEDRQRGLRAYPLPPSAPRLPAVFWLRDTPHLPPAVRNFLALAALG